MTARRSFFDSYSLTRGAWCALAVAAILLSWALFRWATVASRVAEEVTQLQMRAADGWTTWVDAGVPPDSATQLVLTEVRTRLAGRLPATVRTPFVDAAVTEWLWTSRNLNPFSDARASTPRTDLEATSLRVTRTDIQLAFRAGIPTLCEVRATRAQRDVLAASLLLCALAGIVVLRRRPSER